MQLLVDYSTQSFRGSNEATYEFSGYVNNNLSALSCGDYFVWNQTLVRKNEDFYIENVTPSQTYFLVIPIKPVKAVRYIVDFMIAALALDYLHVVVTATTVERAVEFRNLPSTYVAIEASRVQIYLRTEFARNELRSRGVLTREEEFATILAVASRRDAIAFDPHADSAVQTFSVNWSANVLAPYVDRLSAIRFKEKPLFLYQKQAVAWMSRIESLLPIRIAFDNCTSLVDDALWMCETTGGVELSRRRVVNDVYGDFWGGLMALSLGRGKTAISVSLIAASIEARATTTTTGSLQSSSVLLVSSPATLVVVPDQLMTHWIDELELWSPSHLKLRVYACSNIRHFRKLSYNMLQSVDVVLVTRSFLVSQSYMRFVDSEVRAMCPWVPPSTSVRTSLTHELLHLTKCAMFRANASVSVLERQPILSFVLWRRLIVDELHEWLNDVSSSSTMKSNGVRAGSLFELHAQARWGVTATPHLSTPETMRRYASFMMTSPNDANSYTIRSVPTAASTAAATVSDSLISFTPSAIHAIYTNLVFDQHNSTYHFGARDDDGAASLEALYHMQINTIVYQVDLIQEEQDLLDLILSSRHLEPFSLRARLKEISSVSFQCLHDTLWSMMTAASEPKTNATVRPHQQMISWYTIDEVRQLLRERELGDSVLNFIEKRLVQFNTTKLTDTDEDSGSGSGSESSTAATNGEAAATSPSVATLPQPQQRLETCSVCLDDTVTTDVLLPCGHWLCDACCHGLVKNGRDGYASQCPLCRHSFTLLECARVIATTTHDDERMQVDEKVSASSTSLNFTHLRKIYGSKASALLRIIKDAPSGSMFLCVSQYNMISRALVRILREQNIACAIVSGSAACRAAAVKRFKSRQVSVLFITTDAGCAGLHLPEATHIVMTHPLRGVKHEDSKMYNRQMVGRMLRPGFKRANVWIITLVTHDERESHLDDMIDLTSFHNVIQTARSPFVFESPVRADLTSTTLSRSTAARARVLLSADEVATLGLGEPVTAAAAAAAAPEEP